MRGVQRQWESSEIGGDFACSATTGRSTDEWRSQADSGRQTGLDPAFQEVLSPVKSGDRRGRIKVRGICGEILGGYFWMWRCQNKVQGCRYGGNIVEVSFDRFYRVGMARFYLYVVLLDIFL